MITRIQAQKALSTNIQAEMARLGMSQGDLARNLFGEVIGVNDRMKVSRWCNGKSFPDIVDLSNIAEVLGCSIDTLIRGRQQKKKVS